MAARSDTQRAAIRERKRQAVEALKQRHEAQERLQRDAFSALDRLAAQLDRAAETLSDTDGDPLQRATVVTTIATGLNDAITEVRRAASALATGTDYTQADVAKLLGVQRATLFPRRATRPDSTADE